MVCITLRVRRTIKDWEIVDDEAIIEAFEDFITSCDWWQVYDICELLYHHIKSEENKKEYTKLINLLFRDEQLGFEMKEDGKVEKVGSGFIDAKIKEARYLLKEQEFKGADKHFEKAMKSLNERPKPDTENCVKDAVAAIESVGRVIVNNDKALLDDIIKNATKNGVIPKPLDQTFIKLYAYRGNEPGVAHGAVDISKVTESEAELILAMSAAMIIYLVNKREQLS
jgi:hypothetical protein